MTVGTQESLQPQVNKVGRIRGGSFHTRIEITYEAENIR